MAKISSCGNFDRALFKQMRELQRQMDPGIPAGMLSALNALQKALQPFSQISTPDWLEKLYSLNVMQQSTRQIPQLQAIAQDVQRRSAVWSPAIQAAARRQPGSWAVPQIETMVLDLVQASCANLAREAMAAALADSLGAFADLEIPEYDPPEDVPALTEEEGDRAAVRGVV